MVKIALLICGVLTGKARAQNGDYHDIYLRYMSDSLPQQADFILDPYDVRVKMEYPVHEDDYNCMVLTGSPASAYENIEWINKLVAYVKRIAETKPHIKLIGLCFGHQIIARAFGSECVPNGGRWEIGPTTIQLTDLGKQLFGGVDDLTIQQMHRDHVPVVPDTFHLLASNPLTPNHGMVRFVPGSSDPSLVGSVQILTLQGHPEFTEPIVSAIIEQRTSSGSIDTATAQESEKRRFLKTDGVDVVGKTVWQIILEGQ